MKDAVDLITIFILDKRWHWCCLLFFCLCNCTGPATWSAKEALLKKTALTKASLARINIVQKDIRTGDIITRVGNDFTSECLRKINVREKTWSHCGIASIEHDSIFVYHSLGGEFNPDQQLRRDPLTVFADPNTNRGVGIFRQQLSTTELHYLLVIVKKLYASGVMFDMKFDLQTDERMYCAEFVYKAFLWATGKRIHFNISNIKGKNFVGVDDIFLDSHCIQVQKVFYKD